MTLIVLMLCMVGCHFMHVMVFHFARFRRPFWSTKKIQRARVRQITPALLGVVGTVFIAVCSAIVQPLQCDVHPHGLSTMQACGQVHTEGDNKHMLIVGAIASVVKVTVSLPKCLDEGDAVFPNTFAFLFFWFCPGAFHPTRLAPVELQLGSGANH